MTCRLFYYIKILLMLNFIYVYFTQRHLFFFLLFRLSRDTEGYNFDFRIRYKVLPKDKAVVRYGGVKYEGKLFE